MTDPHLSVRELARENEIFKCLIHIIIKENKQHPYHIQFLHE